MKRIFITGYGFLSCLGENKEEMHKNLSRGISAERRIKRFAPEKLEQDSAFEIVENVDYIKYIPPSLFRKMDNPQKYLIYSTKKAIEDAGLSEIEAKEPSIFVGTSFGGTDWTERFFVDILSKGPKFANPQYFPPSVPNAAAGQLSIILGNTQKNHTFCHKEVSGELALYTAIRDLGYKGSESCFVAGFEELGLFIMLAFEKMGVLLKPDCMYCPFICDSGFLMGEGSATAVLESSERASGRGGSPIAEILSVNISSAPCRSYAYPDDNDFYIRVMEDAVKKAGIDYKDISLIISCANSSRLDNYEINALRYLNRKNHTDIPVFAPKGYIGEFYGSGIMRLAIALLSLENNTIYPHSWIKSDPKIGIDVFRPRPLKKRLDYILVNSFSNGGEGISYIIKRYD